MTIRKEENEGSKAESTEVERQVSRLRVTEPDETVAERDEEEEPIFQDDSY